MKFSATIFSIITSLFLFSSCKKDPIVLPESNEPVFRADVNFNGAALSMVAGDNNYYMYTATNESNGVRVFTGELSNQLVSLELGIYDGGLDMINVNSLEGLSQCAIWSEINQQALTVLSKDLFPNADNIASVQWIVNGASFYGDHEIFEPGIYNICALLTFQDASTEQLCEDIIVGYKKTANARINHYLNQAGKMSAWLGNVEGVVQSANWYMDDSLVGQGSELAIELVDVGRHKLNVQIEFEGGVKRSKSIMIDGNLENKYIDDFSIFEKELFVTENRDFNVFLKMTSNGVTYSSEKCDNSNAVISITSVNYYGVNSSGNNAYLVKGHVQCNLSNDSIVVPFDGELQFGIEVGN